MRGSGGQVTQEKKGLHGINCDWLCPPTWAGGLGFKDIRIWNQALLAKHSQKLFLQDDSLLTQVMQAKYGTYQANVS